MTIRTKLNTAMFLVAKINTNSGTVSKAMASADNLSTEMSNGIVEIDRGAKNILQALNNISRISDENRQHTQLLASLTREFKTRNTGGNE